MNLVWKQNNYAGSVTDTSAECLSCCESVPSFWCVSPCFPLPPPPHLSHGHVGWLSLLASRPTVWDVLPVLQSAGKLWQPYLSWRSLTWKNMWKKIRLKGFTASSGTFLHSWSLHRKKEIRIYFPKELRWCNKSCERRKTQDLPNIRMKTVMHIVSMVMEIDKK